MDCVVLYNVTESNFDNIFNGITNSNYIVGFLCVMSVGVCSAYYFVLDRKINKLINKFSTENYPPLYTERA
jgi:hypothetical protein